jgi:hypothetical protein
MTSIKDMDFLDGADEVITIDFIFTNIFFAFSSLYNFPGSVINNKLKSTNTNSNSEH